MNIFCPNINKRDSRIHNLGYMVATLAIYEKLNEYNIIKIILLYIYIYIYIIKCMASAKLK